MQNTRRRCFFLGDDECSDDTSERRWRPSSCSFLQIKCDDTISSAVLRYKRKIFIFIQSVNDELLEWWRRRSCDLMGVRVIRSGPIRRGAPPCWWDRGWGGGRVYTNCASALPYLAGLRVGGSRPSSLRVCVGCLVLLIAVSLFFLQLSRGARCGSYGAWIFCRRFIRLPPSPLCNLSGS